MGLKIKASLRSLVKCSAIVGALSSEDINYPTTHLALLSASISCVIKPAYISGPLLHFSFQAILLCIGLQPQQCLMLSLSRAAPTVSSAATAIPLRVDLRRAQETADTIRLILTSSRTRQPQPTTCALQGPHLQVAGRLLGPRLAIRKLLPVSTALRVKSPNILKATPQAPGTATIPLDNIQTHSTGVTVTSPAPLAMTVIMITQTDEMFTRTSKR